MTNLKQSLDKINQRSASDIPDVTSIIEFNPMRGIRYYVARVRRWFRKKYSEMRELV